MECPSCGEPLVYVDNPMRTEVRHKRGQEQYCSAYIATMNNEEEQE